MGITFGVITSLMLNVFLGWLIGRNIIRRLNAVRATLEAVADGDLTKEIEVTGADEVGAMAKAVARATASLRTTIGLVADNAASLDTSSRYLSDRALVGQFRV